MLTLEAIDFMGVLMQIINAIRTLGDGVAKLFAWIFQAFGLQIPLYVIQIIMTVLLIIMLVKLGGTISKFIIFIVLIFMVLSTVGNVFQISNPFLP